MASKIGQENQVRVNEAARALLKCGMNALSALEPCSEEARKILNTYRPEVIVAQYDRNFGGV